MSPPPPPAKSHVNAVRVQASHGGGADELSGQHERRAEGEALRPSRGNAAVLASG